jgi:hypothetical protein
MSTSLHPKPTIAFELRVQSPRGFLSGEQKALLVDKMEEIATRIAQGRAKIEFSFDLGAVIAKISAKTSPEMIERAKHRARSTSSRGFQGLWAKMLFFWHGLGPEAKVELEKMLVDDYLKDEQSKATLELLQSFKFIMDQMDQTTQIIEIPGP